jgi:predicted small lipoprotein YifL
MERLRWQSAAVAAVVVGTLMGCGAKTGLLIPDASAEEDAGPDAGPDAGDAGPDAAMCMPDELALERRGAQVLFVVDRSNSMNRTLDDRVPDPGEETRWQIVASVLDEVLSEADPTLLEVGAEFFPGILPEGPDIGPMDACMVDPGVDLRPGPGNVDRLLGFFDTTGPNGGTPTAAALGEARGFFERSPALNVPRFVVLATDGGPNCNPSPSPPPPMCVCTGQPGQCDPMTVGEFAAYNCLNEGPTLEVIRALFEELSVPVYVIGIDDPTRPDLADVLDRMAVLGGRPRDEELGGRRFYSVRRPDDLRGALTTITESISNCVFEVDPPPAPDAEVTVTVDGLRVPRDRGRLEGWDFTTPARDELTLFGGACDRATATEADVVAIVECPAE